MDKVTRQCPQTTTFLKRKESRSGIEPRSFRLPAYHLTARPNRLSTFEVTSSRYLYPRPGAKHDIVFVTLLRTVVETATSRVHKLLHTGEVPAALT